MQKEFKRCPKLIVTTEGIVIGTTKKELKLYKRTNMKGEPYLYLQYQDKGSQHKIKVKDMVMETFGEPKDININIDGNYKNNCFENLEALTYEEYILRAFPNVKIRSMDILGNQYLICSNGEIFSLKYEIFMNLYEDRKGYMYCSFRNSTEEKKLKVHRLVAMAFLENYENKETVNHIDANKKNNWDWNLEWATQEEQNEHKRQNNLNPGHSHIKVGMFKDGKLIREFDSISDGARFVGVNPINISEVINNKKGRKTAKGYVWKKI